MRRLLSLLILPLASVSATEIRDPQAFVAEIYQKLIASDQPGARDYDPPEDVYSPRLKTLFAAEKRRFKGEVGCLDFNFWINAQDYGMLKVTRLTSQSPSADRKIVTAEFLNLGEHEEIHFDFQRIKGRWWLDDVRSQKNPPWTLSELLKCK